MPLNHQTYVAKEHRICGVFNRNLDKKVAAAIKKAGDAGETAIKKEIDILAGAQAAIRDIHYKVFGVYMEKDPRANDYFD